MINFGGLGKNFKGKYKRNEQSEILYWILKKNRETAR